MLGNEDNLRHIDPDTNHFDFNLVNFETHTINSFINKILSPNH